MVEWSTGVLCKKVDQDWDSKEVKGKAVSFQWWGKNADC